MAKRMEISLSKDSIARLLEGKIAYEVLPKRAYRFKVGSAYKVLGVEDTYINVLSSELVYPMELDYSKFGIYNTEDKKAFIDKRCGEGTWTLNNRVFFLKLENCIEPPRNLRLKDKFVRKTHIKSMMDVGMFTSKGTDFTVGSVIAASEPYFEICERLGKSYEDILCKEYNVERDELFCINGWLNRGYVRGDLMPRRVKIVASKMVRVRDITDEEWVMLGIGFCELDRQKFVGNDYWLWDKPVRLYKYETMTNNIFEDECTED